MVAENGHCISVGDPRQAVYGFTGSEAAWVPKTPSASLHDHGGRSEELADGVYHALQGVARGSKGLWQWYETIMRRNLEHFGLSGNVSLRIYLEAVAAEAPALSTRLQAFDGLCQFFPLPGSAGWFGLSFDIYPLASDPTVTSHAFRGGNRLGHSPGSCRSTSFPVDNSTRSVGPRVAKQSTARTLRSGSQGNLSLLGGLTEPQRVRIRDDCGVGMPQIASPYP
jgi:hypothetical protein